MSEVKYHRDTDGLGDDVYYRVIDGTQKEKIGDALERSRLNNKLKDRLYQECLKLVKDKAYIKDLISIASYINAEDAVLPALIALYYTKVNPDILSFRDFSKLLLKRLRDMKKIPKESKERYYRRMAKDPYSALVCSLEIVHRIELGKEQENDREYLEILFRNQKQFDVLF